MKISRWLLLTTSFFEGFIRFPLDALMFYYLRNEVTIEVEPAKALVHIQLCVYYYSMSVLPTILPRKSPAYLINFISSSLIFLSLVIFVIVEFIGDPRPKIFLFGTQDKHVLRSATARARFSAEATIGDYVKKCSKISLVILLAMFCGAKTLTTKYITIKQFSLPTENAAYNTFRVYRSTAAGFGKFFGLVLPVYFSKHGPHLHFRNFFLLLSVASAIDCGILVTGFLLRDLRIHDRIPRGLLKFFKLQRRVIKEKFFSKQVQEAQMNEQQEAQEEWKALVKVLPLFIPAVFIIAFRDQRYTQYLNQEEMLVPDVRAEVVLPTVLIFVMYPVTKMIGTIIVDGLIMPYMRRKGMPLTAMDRSVLGFVFVIISFAAASVLQCRVEKTKSPFIDWEESGFLLYNTCDCPAMITIQGMDNEVICPPMFLKKIATLKFQASSWLTVRVECANQDKFSTKAHIHLERKKSNEYLVVKDTPGGIAVQKIVATRFDETFNIHTMLRIIVVPFHTNYSIEFTDVAIVKDGIVDQQHDYSKKRMRYPFFYKDEYLQPGRFRRSGGRLVRCGLLLDPGMGGDGSSREERGPDDERFSEEASHDFGSNTRWNCFRRTTLPWFVSIRYFITVDHIVLLDINITYGASLTCLVSTREGYKMPNTKLFTLMPPNSISIYYQIPQILSLSLSDVMLESPTFLYASNAVPKKWWNLVGDLWLSCGGTGNLITALAMFLGGINRLVMVFLVGFGSCWLSAAMFVQISASMYKVNYEFLEEQEEAKTTKL